MRYSGIIANDVVNGKDVCVSLFLQGCPFHCQGCFNPETWDFNGGIQISALELINTILKLLTKNDVQRNLSILGGEPLTKQNRYFVYTLLTIVKHTLPHTKIFLWTGYTIEELLDEKDECIINILNNIDILIDGRFKQECKKLDLEMRGSTNQRIIPREEIKKWLLQLK